MNVKNSIYIYVYRLQLQRHQNLIVFKGALAHKQQQRNGQVR